MTHHSSHDAVIGILPWYANGTLSAAERELVAAHLPDCAECRDELAFLQGIRSAAADLAAGVPPVPDSFASTMAAIDAWEQTDAAARGISAGSSPVAERPGLWTRITRALDAVIPAPGLPRAAFALQFALVLVLGAALLWRSADTPMTTLSGGQGTEGGARMTVVFQPAATEGAIRAVLLEAGATIVSGPSALGVYVLELPVPPGDTAGVEGALAGLRANADVVRFAEREP